MAAPLDVQRWFIFDEFGLFSTSGIGQYNKNQPTHSLRYWKFGSIHLNRNEITVLSTKTISVKKFKTKDLT